MSISSLIVLFLLIFPGCLSRFETPEERYVDAFLEDVRVGRISQLHSRLSPEFEVLGFRGELPRHPSAEQLLQAFAQIQLRFGISSPSSLTSIRERAVPLAEAERGLQEQLRGESVQSAHEKTFRLIITYRYPVNLMVGRDRVEVLDVSLLSAQVGRNDCSLAEVAAGECQEPPRTVSTIRSVRVLDPCLFEANRQPSC